MKVTCIFSLKKDHQFKYVIATTSTHSYHENNNSRLQKSHHVDATFSIKLINAAWTSIPNLHVQPWKLTNYIISNFSKSILDISAMIFIKYFSI